MFQTYAPVFTIGQWQAEIADSSRVGWFTVCSYYFCAALSLACVFKARAEANAEAVRFRILLTGVIVVLGMCKQFNLPGAVTEIGRIVANHLGRYEWRRWAQVLVLLIGGFVFIRVVASFARHPAFFRSWRRYAPEMICLGWLGGLVILRAISFHYIGAVLAVAVHGVSVNRLVELGGIYALISILLVRLLSRTSRRCRSQNAHDSKDEIAPG